MRKNVYNMLYLAALVYLSVSYYGAMGEFRESLTTSLVVTPTMLEDMSRVFLIFLTVIAILCIGKMK